MGLRAVPAEGVVEVERILVELHARLEGAGTHLDGAQGVLLVPAGGAADTVSIQVSVNGALCLRADAGALPAHGAPACCVYLLAANVFSRSSGGGAFALDEQGRVHLLRHVPRAPGADYAWLCDVVHRFTAAAAHFRSVVEMVLSEDTPSDRLSSITD
jgi:Tir chaperone protein (CesT) family